MPMSYQGDKDAEQKESRTIFIKNFIRFTISVLLLLLFFIGCILSLNIIF